MNLRNTLLGLTLIFFSFNTNAQSNGWNEQVLQTAPGWYKIQDEANIAVESFFEKFAEPLGLHEGSDQMVLLEKKKDHLGFVHYKYQQHYKGIPVEGAIFLLHEKDGRLQTANGKLISGINSTVAPQTNKEQAISAATAHIGAQKYMWEKGQVGPTHHPSEFAPEPQLRLAHKAYSANGEEYRLVWKMDIFASQPMDRKWVFVDASSGEVAYTLDRIHHNDTGTAVTKYSGTRQIITDSVGPNNYRLRETLTGGGVETFNMQNSRNFGNAVDFTDADNYWDNFNANQDEVATDAHWGAEAVYHYFYDNHGRDSYDDQGSKLESYVHYDNNYVNAFWNGSWMTYGDGAGSYSPLVSLDVVAHEITHGVTGNSANLIYQNESGALNESFSDIFAAAVEFAFDSANADWIIGEDFTAGGTGLRSMSNPNAYNDPNTYKGVNWGYGPFVDNGYVHKNSGVQNYWFYLLSDGEAGTNDNGDEYLVKSIGVQKAAAISYRNLTVYLGPTSNHLDARAGSIQAAEDLYGICSFEAIQVANAWYAVGIGDPTGEVDLELFSIDFPQVDCSLGNSESLSVSIRNNSCSYAIPAGDSLEMSFLLNATDSAREYLVLNQALPAGSQRVYTFNSTLDLSAVQNHNLEVQVSYASDSTSYNDKIDNYSINNRTQQNADIELLSILSPVSGCDLSNNTDLRLELFFNGCDSLSAGSTIDFNYQVSGNAQQSISYTLNQPVFYGDTFTVNLPAGIDFSNRGNYSLNVAVDMANDPTSANDAINNHPVKNPFDILGHRLSFERNSYNDSIILTTGSEASARVRTASTHGMLGLKFTGGNTIYYPEELIEPTSANVWNENEEFSSEMCTCIDASNYGSLNLDFDRQLLRSELYGDVLGEFWRFSSALRVKVNGLQVSPTYRAITPDSDPYSDESIDLSDYAGTEFELCFETLTLTRKTFNNLTNDGDEVNLDNIRLSGSQIGLEENGLKKQGIVVYPNPSQGNVKLAFPENTRGHYTLLIQDMTGKVIQRKDLKVEPAKALYELEISAATGVYFLNIENGGSLHQTHKLIIQ